MKRRANRKSNQTKNMARCLAIFFLSLLGSDQLYRASINDSFARAEQRGENQSRDASQPGFDELFPAPRTAPVPPWAALLGYRTQNVRELLSNPTAAKQRAAVIKELTESRTKDTLRFSRDLNKVGRLHLAVEDQAAYFAFSLLGEISDEQRASMETSLREIRRQQSQALYEALINKPAPAVAEKISLQLLIARLRLGDTSAYAEASEKLSTNDEKALALIGNLQTVLDYTLKRLPNALPIRQVRFEKSESAVEKLFGDLLEAESFATPAQLKNKANKLMDGLRKADALKAQFNQLDKNIISRFFADNLLNATKPDQLPFDQATFDLVKAAGHSAHASTYIERYALNEIAINPTMAIKYYFDLLDLNKESSDKSQKIEKRIFDIAFYSADPVLLEGSWSRILPLKKTIQASWNTYVQRTLEMMLLNYRKSPSAENARRFVRMFDLLSAGSENKDSLKGYQFFVVDALYRIQDYREVVKRSETLIKGTEQKNRSIDIFRMNLTSRLKLMGFDQADSIGIEAKLQATEQEIAEYFKNTESYLNLTPSHMHSAIILQSAKVSLLNGDLTASIEQFRRGFMSASPEGLSAKESARFAIAKFQKLNKPEELEKILRSLLERGIIPEAMSREDFTKLTSETIFSNSEKALAESKPEAAVIGYQYIVDRLKSSEVFKASLERAGFSYAQTKRFDKAIPLYQIFLKQNLDRKQRLDAEWLLAELYALSKDYEAAALAYRQFRLQHVSEGKQQRAALLAGKQFRFARRFQDALSEFELQLSIDKDPKDRKTVFSEIYETGIEGKNLRAQVRGLEGLSGLESDKRELTKIWSRLQVGFDELDQRASARRAAQQVLAINETSESSAIFRAQARQYLAFSGLAEFRTGVANANTEAYQLDKIIDLSNRYDTIKPEVLAPCEVTGAPGCSKGMFAVTEFAAELFNHLSRISLPKYFQPELVTEIQTTKQVLQDKLKADILSFSQRIIESEGAQREITVQEANLMKDLFETFQKLRNEAPALP